jgi:tRNA(adenine34) deaminase
VRHVRARNSLRPVYATVGRRFFAQSVIVMNQSQILPIDLKMMERCIALSSSAAAAGELPFAALICRGGEIIAEATNRVVRDADVTRHAELLALSQAQKTLGQKSLAGCTIYSNVEPCPMCAFPIRETGIARVVYAISSPLMGGLSKWNILRDTEISTVVPEVFADVPEVLVGVLGREAERVWRRWNPIAWGVIKYRGCFHCDSPQENDVRVYKAAPSRSVWRGLLAFYRKAPREPVPTESPRTEPL